MTTFLVWDELNSEQAFASEIEARDAQRAAEKYAEEDSDGHIDGLYHGAIGQPICVLDDGVVRRFAVTVNYAPVFSAAEMKSK